jgi:FixJ family two-component response regulator
MSDKASIVWLIDDDENDAEEYERFLELSGELEIVFVQPRPSLSDYVDLITNPDTAAFIIDQRLSDSANAPYEGLDLADYLRTLRPELPIYILTNYADDTMEGKGQSADAIIKKGNVRDYTEVTIARILRSVKRYEEALTEKQYRLKTLIDHKITNQLTDVEEKELESLRADIERSFDLALSDQEQKREVYLQEQEERLAKLEEIAQKFLKGLTKDN